MHTLSSSCTALSPLLTQTWRVKAQVLLKHSCRNPKQCSLHHLKKFNYIDPSTKEHKWLLIRSLAYNYYSREGNEKMDACWMAGHRHRAAPGVSAHQPTDIPGHVQQELAAVPEAQPAALHHEVLHLQGSPLFPVHLPQPQLLVHPLLIPFSRLQANTKQVLLF